ncbi:hypothetical protein FHU34_115003 [Micromonospora taraxaci]|uniref:Uncharacterized protein n=1 Tax=Micromonospora taraxaci TaxID=1316803 RepID=A0A561W6X2_9ACTN|nr:hypothetical protein FHU34_115003 [Micromonospora taraxaci]
MPELPIGLPPGMYGLGGVVPQWLSPGLVRATVRHP